MDEQKPLSILHSSLLPTGIGRGWVQPEKSEDDLDDLWLRWDPKEFIRVRVTSPEPFNYEGHWVPALGTYRRCSSPRCPFCPLPQAEQQPGRLYASEARWRHLLAVQLDGGTQRIWEFSPKIAVRLQVFTMPRVDGQIIIDQPLRGLTLVLGREGRRKNGEVWCEAHDDPFPGRPVPEPIDVAGYLAQTWRRAAIRDGKALAVSRATGQPDDSERPTSF